jgi:hypothetical protein
MLENPENEIESREYFSWERFFTAQLIMYTQNNYLKYTKKQLNPSYLDKNISNKILKVMKMIELT